MHRLIWANPTFKSLHAVSSAHFLFLPPPPPPPKKKKSFKNTIRSVAPDLGPNCLLRLSADEQEKIVVLIVY